MLISGMKALEVTFFVKTSEFSLFVGVQRMDGQPTNKKKTEAPFFFASQIQVF